MGEIVFQYQTESGELETIEILTAEDPIDLAERLTKGDQKWRD